MTHILTGCGLRPGRGRKPGHDRPGPDEVTPLPSGPGTGASPPGPGTSRPGVTPAGHDTGPAGVTFPALGTTASVLVTDPRARDTAAAMLAAELSAIDAACSRFRADSELSRLNRAAGAARSRSARCSPRPWPSRWPPPGPRTATSTRPAAGR